MSYAGQRIRKDDAAVRASRRAPTIPCVNFGIHFQRIMDEDLVAPLAVEISATRRNSVLVPRWRLERLAMTAETGNGMATEGGRRLHSTQDFRPSDPQVLQRQDPSLYRERLFPHCTKVMFTGSIVAIFSTLVPTCTTHPRSQLRPC
jgi:hypothetical protein